MHILEIPSFLPPLGGAFCLEQAEALAHRGHQMGIIACNQYGITSEPNLYLSAPFSRQWTEKNGINTCRTVMRGVPRMVKYNQQRWCSIVGDMYIEYCKRHGRPDVLHAHCAQWAGVAAMMISKHHDVPYFITEHISSGLYRHYYGANWEHNVWARHLLTAAYGNATCVIPVAQELVHDTAPFFGTDYTHHAISNIVDVDYYSYRPRPTLQGRPYRYCYIGNAMAHDFHLKGLDILSLAFRNKENSELHLLGPGTTSSQVREAFPHDTYFHGKQNREGVRDLLYLCDALILPSRSEVQPLVVLEALSTGIPVVVSECIPQNERIEGGCLVAPTGDALALSEKMDEVRYIPSSEKFSQAIRAMAAPDVVAREIEELFLIKLAVPC